MITKVVALCLFLSGNLIEHRIQDDMRTCLKHKREAERQFKPNLTYMCGNVEAEIESNIDGSRTIKMLITKVE